MQGLDKVEIYGDLAISLVIGLLIGLERGWQQREAADGTRVAGIRTYALIGLLGGVLGVLSLAAGDAVLAAGFLGFIALVVVARWLRYRHGADVGMTSEVASLLALTLAMLAVRVDEGAAAAAAVVVVGFLGAKEPIHRWLQRIENLELDAAIKLLLISVVLLPVLPNRGFGPGASVNPFKLWLLVVMIAALSFVGYFAIKIAGPRLGSVLTGAFGGLASSTAVTVSFARLGHEAPALQSMLAAGAAVAAAMMFLRILVVVAVINPDLVPPLALILGAMAAVGFAGALLLWLRSGSRGHRPAGRTVLQNPFELGMALKFAAFLAAVLILADLAKQWLGSAGLYALAAISGIADVDAISLSLATVAPTVGVDVAVTGIVIAAVVNTVVKAGIVWGLCGGTMAVRVTLLVTAMLMVGGLAWTVR